MRADRVHPAWGISLGFVAAAAQTGVGIYLNTQDDYDRTIGRFVLSLGLAAFGPPIALLGTRAPFHPALPESALTERELGFYEGILAAEAVSGRRSRWIAGALGASTFVGKAAALSLVFADGRDGRRRELVAFGVGMLGNFVAIVIALLPTRAEKVWARYRSGAPLGDPGPARISLTGDSLTILF